jgi:hypothetical protein
MVVRQVLLGVSGGAVLALLALFLTVPGSFGQAAAARWLSNTAHGFAWDMTPEAVASQGDAAVLGLEDDPGSQPAPGALVASLGAVGHGTEEVPADDALPSRRPPLSAPSADQLDADSYLGALSKQTIIRSRPHPEANIVGFARTGALLRRAAIPASREGCSEGWYRVEPDGYVCAGKTTTFDPHHPIIRLASVQPDRSLALPYAYGSSRYPTPPLYTRIPTKEQQQIAEQDLVGHARKNFGSVWVDAADTPPPQLLEDGSLIPRPYGYPRLEHDFMTGRALGKSAFAFIDMFEAEGRRWGLTADLSLLPLDRLTPVQGSEFNGVQLSEGATLPVAFVRSRAQHVYEAIFSPEKVESEEETKPIAFQPKRAITFRESFHLTGKSHKLQGSVFLETREGTYIKDHPLVVKIERRGNLPKWAKDSRSWIDVSILNQTLVAYKGETPIFATLVSTGRDGLGDPETTHSTVQGVFLIHTKHVTSTMSGNAADDEFDLRDVPYVQYFQGGYAFHAAFWHDGFGHPRSHGCVNLSPPDARYLFSLTDPPVPLRWHSALSRQGTLVHIHP